MSEICGVFAVTLIWIVQNYLRLLSCPVVSVIAIHFCMVSLTLTSPGFSVLGIDWPAWWQSFLHLRAVFTLLRSLHWLLVRVKTLFEINFFIYKTLSEKQPVYLQFMLATSLPSRSLRSYNDNSRSVPRVKTITGARAFHSCAPSLWNNLLLSVRSAISAIPSRNISKHISWTWPFLL